MKNTILSALVPILLAGLGFGQTPATPVHAQTPAQFAPNILISAELSKSVDAKKLKVGDNIEAKTVLGMLSNGKIVLPRETKILGHVVSVKPHSKQSPDSAVAIVFDRVMMKDGREFSLKTSVQAIGAPLNPFASADSPIGPLSPSMQPGGGNPGGVGGPSGGALGTGERSSSPTSASYPTGGRPSGPDSRGPVSALSTSSQGVVGLKDLSLRATAEASVVSSSNKNVHLDSGSQLILKVQ